ncbi:hypothetical protein MCO_01413 [Bartonella sp. DB5-6]|nr:hypothetical protein MCO_01413 [Bartonella sp. DB5-6]
MKQITSYEIAPIIKDKNDKICYYSLISTVSVQEECILKS